jgi:hypothetical protein
MEAISETTPGPKANKAFLFFLLGHPSTCKLAKKYKIGTKKEPRNKDEKRKRKDKIKTKIENSEQRLKLF